LTSVFEEPSLSPGDLRIRCPGLNEGSSKTEVNDLFSPFTPYWLVRELVLALAIALKGGEIIGLILCFYAAYLSTAWIPFTAYLLAHLGVYTFSKTSVRLSLVISGLSVLSTLTIVLLQPRAIAFNSPELTIMAIGLGLGSLSLFGTQVLEKYFPGARTQEEMQ